MFNCLSRKQKPSNISLVKPKSQKTLMLSACSSIVTQRQKKIKDLQQIKQEQIKLQNKDASIVKNSFQEMRNTIDQSIKLKSVNIEELQEEHIISKSMSRNHKPLKSNMIQQNKNLPSAKASFRKNQTKMDQGFEKEKVSNIQEGLSITSFGQVFQQVEVGLKKQTMESIEELTFTPSLLPKNVHISLLGMNKTMSQDQVPSVNFSLSQKSTILNININEKLSQYFISNKYEEAQQIFNKMTVNQKNGSDLKGFTPVYLLTLLSLTNSEAFCLLKKILKDPELEPNKKIYFGSKPIQQAIIYKNIPVLTVLFRCSYLHKISEIKKTLKELASFLFNLPDMYLQLYVKVGSFVPLVDKITPDDTIKIFKKGNQLRIDYSLVGYQYLKCKRRWMSCVLQKLSDGQYTIVGLNHEKKTMADLLQPFEDQQFILLIQDLLSTQIKRINPQIESVQIEKQYNIFKNIIREYIIDRVAVKHQLKVKYTSATQKLNPQSKDSGNELKFLKCWKDYLSYIPDLNIAKRQKQIKLGVWLSNQFDLKLNQLLKLIKFLSFFHQSGNIIHDFLSDEKISNSMSGFPVKIQIPMSFSLYLDVKISNFSFKVPEVQLEGKYEKEKRSLFQKTLSRRQKRLSFLKLYT